MNLKMFLLKFSVLGKTMAKSKWASCAVSVVVCLALFPCGAFGDFERNLIFHSAEEALAAVEKLQIRCKVGLTYSEYTRALDNVQYEINRLDAHFTRSAEKALTEVSISRRFDASTCRLLGDLHLVLSFHELVRGWWDRKIEKLDDPICLDLMFSSEWEEITLLLEDAGEQLQIMKYSLQ
jgi:hypothetical protein